MIDQPDPMDSLLTGIGMLEQGNRSGAKDFFMSYLDRHPDNQAAYVELYACSDSKTLPGLVQYFKSLPSQAAKEQTLLLSNLYLMQGNANSAKQVNGTIIAANPNTSVAGRAQFNNFYIALYNDNDPRAASSILSDIEKGASLSTPMEISDAEHALATYVNPKTGKSINMSELGNGTPVSDTLASELASDNLMANYPNPFNPSTTIRYNLPATGHVTLKIYDILGREVVTLVNENQGVGVHIARFDGTRLASGLYFYRLSAPGVSQVKKMLMVK